MRLSTKGRYAVTAMLELALHAGKGPVTLADISVSQGISLSYLEQLFAALRAKKLVRGVRGPGGGYYLGQAAEEITIASIICAVDEWVEFTRCSDRENCEEQPGATPAAATHTGLTQNLWNRLSDDIFRFLDSITLRTLIDQGQLDHAQQCPPTASPSDPAPDPQQEQNKKRRAA